MGDLNELQATRDALVRPGKGILAADESGPTIAKRLKAKIEQAGLGFTVTKFYLGSAALGLAIAVVCFLAGMPLLIVLVVLLVI